MYVTFRSVCSICGEFYASRKVEHVFKEGSLLKKALDRYGYIPSHGYCPTCERRVRQELRLVARKTINTYA